MEGLTYTPEDITFKKTVETGHFYPELEKVQVVGKELQEGEYNEVVARNERTGEVITRRGEGLLPDQVISWDNLVAVRADWNAPKLEDSGEFIVETPFSKTNGETVRLTTHWTLNHRVEEHSESGYEEGSGWGDAPYVIISPMRGMIEKNNKPLNVLSVDTFWGKDVKLPEGSVLLVRSDVPNSQIPESAGVTIIPVEGRKNMENLIPQAIKKMGYTCIRGGKLGAMTENFDDIVTSFAKSEGVEFTTAHSNDAIETIQTSLERYFTDANLREFLALVENLGEIPDELKERIFEPIEDAISSTDFETRLEAYGLIEEVFQEDVHPQIKKALIRKLGPYWDRFLEEYSDYMETIDLNGKRNTLEYFTNEVKTL